MSFSIILHHNCFGSRLCVYRIKAVRHCGNTSQELRREQLIVSLGRLLSVVKLLTAQRGKSC